MAFKRTHFAVEEYSQKTSKVTKVLCKTSPEFSFKSGSEKTVSQALKQVSVGKR
jgi:hypothetical protein